MSIFDLENRLPLLKRTATLSLKLPKVTTLCPPIPTIPPGHHLVPTYPYNSPRSPPCAQLSLQLPKVTTLCPPIPTTPPGHHSVPTYTYNSLSAPPPSSCWSSRWREKKVVLVISEKERGRYTSSPPQPHSAFPHTWWLRESWVTTFDQTVITWLKWRPFSKPTKGWKNFFLSDFREKIISCSLQLLRFKSANNFAISLLLTKIWLFCFFSFFYSIQLFDDKFLQILYRI